MFEKARLKLTSYYLLIIMIISFCFSFVIYRQIGSELNRGLHQIERRLMMEEKKAKFPHNPPTFIKENLDLAKNRVLVYLIRINGVILIVSGLASYFLAGKTLEPIKKALEDQKRFVADASHELKTPLTAQKAGIEVALRDRKLTLGKAKKVLKSNLEEIDSLQLLTEGLLVLARSQEDNGNSFKAVNLGNLIKRTVKKFQPLAKKKKIKIEVDLKKVIVKGDRAGLEKMITIFLDNGIKYTGEKGKIIIKLKKKNNKAILEIKDTGRGISKKELPYIFNRFYRADKARSKDGFGLGLSIAQKIIKLHHGSVRAESKLNKGTAFTIKLPLK